MTFKTVASLTEAMLSASSLSILLCLELLTQREIAQSRCFCCAGVLCKGDARCVQGTHSRLTWSVRPRSYGLLAVCKASSRDADRGRVAWTDCVWQSASMSQLSYDHEMIKMLTVKTKLQSQYHCGQPWRQIACTQIFRSSPAQALTAQPHTCCTAKTCSAQIHIPFILIRQPHYCDKIGDPRTDCCLS